MAQLPQTPGLVLDFGAADGNLAITAAFHGHRVVAVDLEACRFPFESNEIEYRQGDFNVLEVRRRVVRLRDQLLDRRACRARRAIRRPRATTSTRTLRAMERMARLLKPGGGMVLTIQVGRDAVFSPAHRIYGAPNGYHASSLRSRSWSSRYWAKPRDDRWVEVDRQAALAEQRPPRTTRSASSRWSKPRLTASRRAARAGRRPQYGHVPHCHTDTGGAISNSVSTDRTSANAEPSASR